MKSNASLLAMLAIATGMLLGAASGCELIAGVDRNKITETGGAGGEGGTTASTGGGGTTTSSSDTGGTTTSGPNCVDPLADCGTPSGECKVFSCVEGECVEGNVANGMDATTQTAMDCKKNICTDGEVVSLNDDTDPLDDNNDCTVDVCEMGDPKSNPADLGTPCTDGANKVCDDMSTCVECNVDADCKDVDKPDCLNKACVPETCSDGMTNAGETDQDCGGPCKGCDTNQNCDDAADCFHGVCGGNGKCAAPTCDDDVQNGGDYLGSNGETDKDCGGPCGPTCGPMLGCEVNGDCVGNQCTGAGGTCVPNCLDGVKNNAETDKDCGGGTCGGCAVGELCEGADANCVGTAYCDVTVCAAKKMPGVVCAGANQCTSNFCVDGVCCNNACGATCSACDLPGTVGTCTFVPAGDDPDTECMGNGGADVCDGASACAEVNGSPCAASSECASNTCVDGVCCATSCEGTCEACSNAKSGGPDGTCTFVPNTMDPDAECPASLQCNGSGACQTKLAQGSTCTVSGECQSNNCVDNVCCGSACGGACQACSTAKKGSGPNGTCGAIGTGLDPDNECAGATTCNGGGACLLANGATCGGAGECQSNFCVDTVCCDAACLGADCVSCNLMGSVGTCSPVPAGADPGNDCNGSDPAPECNGAGACGLGAIGAPCANPAGCASGVCTAGLCAN